MKTEILTPSHKNWGRVRAMIESQYFKVYGAEIEVHAPELLAIFNKSGDPVAASGLRDERAGFFSESYLDAPAHELIQARSGKTVGASDIIEIVTFTAVRPVLALRLLDAVTSIGRDKGKNWALFTASQQIRTILTRTAKPFLSFGAALPERVSNPLIWGDYYKAEPEVCALYDSALRFDPRGGGVVL